MYADSYQPAGKGITKRKRDGESPTLPVSGLVFEVLHLHCSQYDPTDHSNPCVALLVNVRATVYSQSQGPVVVDSESDRYDKIPNQLVATFEVIIEPSEDKQKSSLFPDTESKIDGEYNTD